MPSSPSPVVDAAALAAVPRRLPHAPPFRLVDRVLSADLPMGALVAERCITSCALWPAEAGLSAGTRFVFPEVLVVEALCQAAACLNILESAPDAASPHHGYLVAISNFRFRQDFDSAQLVRPSLGDTLILHVTRQSRLSALVAFAATAHVRTANSPSTYELASGQLMFAIEQGNL